MALEEQVTMWRGADQLRSGGGGDPLGTWTWALQENSTPDIKMQKGSASGEV